MRKLTTECPLERSAEIISGKWKICILTKLSKSNKISSELSYNNIQLDYFNEFNSLIEKFFDNVLVNDKNNQIKNNRIKLLENIKLNFEMICKFQLLKI